MWESCKVLSSSPLIPFEEERRFKLLNEIFDETLDIRSKSEKINPMINNLESALPKECEQEYDQTVLWRLRQSNWQLSNLLTMLREIREHLGQNLW